MSIAIGFGASQQEVERELERMIRLRVKDRAPTECEYYFSTDFTKSVGAWLEGLSKESRALADEYRTAEDHPDRYTSFFAVTLGDASHIVFILKFHHINRRHSLSPDGWALLETERVFYIRHGD